MQSLDLLSRTPTAEAKATCLERDCPMLCKFCREDLPAIDFTLEDYDRAKKTLRIPTCIACRKRPSGSKKARRAAVREIMHKLHLNDKEKVWQFSNDEQKKTLQFANRTKHEIKLCTALTEAGLTFEPQHRVGSYWIDIAFVEQRLAVEVDGSIHLTEKQKKHDRKRTHTLKQSHHWDVIRFTNLRIDACLEDVVKTIKMTLLSRRKDNALSSTTMVVYVPPATDFPFGENA